MNVTIYTLTYNEAYMLPHFIAHYRRNFPGCRIVVYDNESTDNTRAIAEAAGCEVRINATGGKLDDMRYLEIKDHCWKELQNGASPYFQGHASRGAWAIVCDCDEFLDITAAELAEEHANGTHYIRAEAYNMVNVRHLPFNSINYAVRATSYDKVVCFDTCHVAETRYSPGCHFERLLPRSPNERLQGAVYRLRHYKYMGISYMVARFATNAARLCDNNLAKGYGGHYLATEHEIKREFDEACRQAKQIII